MKVRKRAIEVEAVRWPGPDEPSDEGTYPRWFQDLIRESRVVNLIDWSTGSIMIPTAEGVMECRIGDYVIQGVAGELYPCKPEIFEATYDRIG